MQAKRIRQANKAWASETTGSDRIPPHLQTALVSSGRVRMGHQKQIDNDPSTLIQSE
jgi:hypothetical protein